MHIFHAVDNCSLLLPPDIGVNRVEDSSLKQQVFGVLDSLLEVLEVDEEDS